MKELSSIAKIASRQSAQNALWIIRRTISLPQIMTVRRWSNRIVRENKLGMLKDLKTNIERKQGELMDFIVNLKDQKKDLKKNMKE